MSRPQPVRCGDQLLGWVHVTGQDGYWMLGTFEPAAEFERRRALFDHEEELSRRLDETAEEDYCAASDAWQAALDQINELNLSIGEPGAPTRDFKFTGPGKVEFKWEP